MYPIHSAYPYTLLTQRWRRLNLPAPQILPKVLTAHKIFIQCLPCRMSGHIDMGMVYSMNRFIRYMMCFEW